MQALKPVFRSKFKNNYRITSECKKYEQRLLKPSFYVTEVSVGHAMDNVITYSYTGNSLLFHINDVMCHCVLN